MDIDYALAFDFLDDDGRPYQLRFRRDTQLPDAGQLIAVIAKSRPDNGRTVAISRPGVTFHDVMAALEGWPTWARLSHNTVHLPAIRRRIDDAGLGLTTTTEPADSVPWGATDDSRR
ncbi:hypothetical protein [Mycobacterium spongiae]|uniref:hypothetical protein n=1 Tax=Mycobacterium spongiae TaxID=886343 RepID=UPI001FE873C8|nr:hypothetical protein [Mycobacterium spongiae]